jgi:hypothetical protein
VKSLAQDREWSRNKLSLPSAKDFFSPQPNLHSRPFANSMNNNNNNNNNNTEV